ncbi:hypothetical protein SAMN05443246_2535 [Paenibacillus sp. GP183]|jgi:hypothetical protein|nr:hypothetical protein SAMN05443246_2535 [Paenibacillus sp. GP183]
MALIQSSSTFSRTIKNFSYKKLVGGIFNWQFNQTNFRDIRVTEL